MPDAIPAYIIKEKIIALSERSDRDAFDFLFRTFCLKVHRFSIGYLKSSTEAEEIVQETFVRIWENRKSINSDHSFSGYIFTIAYHLILNRIRKLRNEMNCLSTLRQHWPSSHNDTEQSVLTDDLFRIHAEIVTHLPPVRKRIFQLIREEGMTYKQVADQLNISVKTVEAHMTEAMKYFRDSLQKLSG